MNTSHKSSEPMEKRDRLIVMVVYVLYMFGLFTSFISAVAGLLVALLYARNAKSEAGKLALSQQKVFFLRAILGFVAGFSLSFLTLFLIDTLKLPSSFEVVMYIGVAISGLSILWFLFKSFAGFRSTSRALIKQRLEAENELEQQDTAVSDLESQADQFMAMLEECYEFGDPSYESFGIYRDAESKFGYGESEVDDLLANLRERNIIKFEVEPGPHSHPADVYDRWRLVKPDGESAVDPSADPVEEDFDGTATLSQLKVLPTALLEPVANCLRDQPEVQAAYYLVMQDQYGESLVIGLLGEGDIEHAVDVTQDLVSSNSYTDMPVLVVEVNLEGEGAVSDYFRSLEPFYQRAN